MRIMTLHLFLYFFLIMSVSVPLARADESISIITYYPSPYGSYDQLYVADKLGIGTTAPSVPLEVVGNIKASTNVADNCEWVQVTTGSAYLCPSGKFVTGVRDVNPADGSIDGIYCCEL